MAIQDTSKDDWESQLTDYTFGVMDAETASRFEHSLMECREHVALANEYSEVAAWLALSTAPAEPPQGHKTRLMSRIGTMPQTVDTPEPVGGANTPTGARPLVSETQSREQTQERVVDLGAYREKRRPNTFFPALAAAAAALILFVGLWGWQSVQEAKRSVKEAQERLNIPPGYIAFAVEGQGDTTANAVAFVNPDSNQAALLANGLTPLPADKVYELWLLPSAADRKPVAAGVFNAGIDGQARHEATAPSTMRDYVGVAVTIEDAPGVQESQQQPILVGTFATP